MGDCRRTSGYHSTALGTPLQKRKDDGHRRRPVFPSLLGSDRKPLSHLDRDTPEKVRKTGGGCYSEAPNLESLAATPIFRISILSVPVASAPVHQDSDDSAG